MVPHPGGLTDATRAAAAAAGAAFALKVDVDTLRGLVDGTPRLLELFSRHRVRATWFVAMGPDRSGVAALRVFRQRGFLGKMLRSGAPRIYPLETMLRGTLLPARPIAESAPERLREIIAAGHEIAIHGYDHVRWHDRLTTMSLTEVRSEVGAASRVFTAIVGRKPSAFAAPGWQCTAASLEATDELGVSYRSDTRGVGPYLPKAGAYRSAKPEIPSTLPTLDEILGREGTGADELADFLAARIPADRLSVHTVHTEIEGGPCLGHLDALLRRVVSRLPVATLGEVASRLAPLDSLPVCEVVPGILPGRGGTVACQGAPS